MVKRQEDWVICVELYLYGRVWWLRRISPGRNTECMDLELGLSSYRMCCMPPSSSYRRFLEHL